MNNSTRQKIIAVDLLEEAFPKISRSKQVAFMAQLEVSRLLLEHATRFADTRTDRDTIHRAIVRVGKMQDQLRASHENSQSYLG